MSGARLLCAVAIVCLMPCTAIAEPATAPVVAEQADPQLRQMLLTGYRAAFSTIEDIRLEVRDGSAEGRMVHYVRKGDRERVGPLPPAKATYFEVSDAQFYLSFYAVEDGATKVGHAVLEPAKGGLLRRGPEATDSVAPLFNLFGTAYGKRPDDVLTSNQLTIVSGGQIDGLDVYEVSAPLDINRIVYNVTFWLAPERSFLPLRMEVCELDGRLTRAYAWTKFENFPDGQWFPREVFCRHYFRLGNTPAEVTEYSVEAVVIERNPKIPDEVFTTDPESLPPGTRIRDDIRDRVYIIGEGPISEADLQRVADEIVNRVDPPAQSSPSRPLLAPSGIAASPMANEGQAIFGIGWPLFVLLAFCVTACVGAGIWYAYRRRRQVGG